jgi:hypothetical protein
MKQIYTSTPPLGLRVPSQGDLYLYLYPLYSGWHQIQCPYKTTAKFITLYISALQLLNNTRKAKHANDYELNSSKLSVLSIYYRLSECTSGLPLSFQIRVTWQVRGGGGLISDFQYLISPREIKFPARSRRLPGATANKLRFSSGPPQVQRYVTSCHSLSRAPVISRQWINSWQWMAGWLNVIWTHLSLEIISQKCHCMY